MIQSYHELADVDFVQNIRHNFHTFSIRQHWIVGTGNIQILTRIRIKHTLEFNYCFFSSEANILRIDKIPGIGQASQTARHVDRLSQCDSI